MKLIKLLPMTLFASFLVLAESSIKYDETTGNIPDGYNGVEYNFPAGTTIDSAAVLTLAGGVFTGGISFSGTDYGGLTVISLSTAQRDALTPANGTIIYNTTTSQLESYENGGWGVVGSAASGDQWGDVVDADVIPDADGLRDLGTNIVRFAEAYFDALDIAGSIIVSGTVDGRDLATDGVKLDGIEALADVTDTANVTAAGALMDSEIDADLKTLALPASVTISAFGSTIIDDADTAAVLATLSLDADFATLSVPASTTISAFGATLVDDADAATVLATLTLDGDLATLSIPASTTISAFGATLTDDADAATARGTLGLVIGTDIDPAGTDNSTDVTLAGTPDYITIAGQVITRGQIDLTSDVTGVLPIANIATGTPNGTQFVRDDGTLATPAGSGTMTTVKLNDSQVGDSDIATLDFSSEFGVSESPDTEIQITINAGITRDTEWDTFAELNAILGLDADIATLALPASTTISAFGATLTDDADAATARGTLGLVIGTDIDPAGTDNSTDVTLAGSPDYITISGSQTITRHQIDLAADVTGNLPVGNLNGGTGASSSTFWRGDGTWAATVSGDAWGDPVDAVITPDADGTRDLATTGTRFATAYVDDLDVTTNIVVGGTVDGRDLATDGAKLDGIDTGTVYFPARSTFGSGLIIGTVVCLDATDGYDAGAGYWRVNKADADTATKRAIGICAETVNTVAIGPNGNVMVQGTLTGIDTSAYSIGDVLYLSQTAGELTDTKPTGGVLVQPIAIVTESHATTGEITIIPTMGSDTHGITLAGTPNYITLSGSVITRGLVDLATDVTGNLPVNKLNSGTGASVSTYWRGDGTWAAATGSGDEWGDVVDAVITPDADGTRDLATTGTRFATGYFDDINITDTVTAGTVKLDDDAVTSFSTDQHNLALSANFHHRLTATAAGTAITGISGPTNDVFVLTNVGNYTIVLKHNSGSSSDGNRFSLPMATDYRLPPECSVICYGSDEDDSGTDSAGDYIYVIGKQDTEEKVVQIVVTDYTTDTAVGDGAAYFVVPDNWFGTWLLNDLKARVITAGTTGTLDVQIHNVTQAADMLSTKLTINSAQTSSETATAAVIDVANDDVAVDDLIRIDVDAIHTTAAKGLIITLEFTR